MRTIHARIAEKWRSGRWDSLVANGPAWHGRFPNRNFDDPDHDAFIPKEDVADYFVDYVAGIHQIHSNAYRNPEALPEGVVMVVGAGSSGAQIAEELMNAGRQIYLSVGPHGRQPRSYRGRDFCWWLGVLGKWDLQTPGPGTEHVTIVVSGAKGGRTVDFRRFAAGGMQLVGRTEKY